MMINYRRTRKFIKFLQQELQLSKADISVVLRHNEAETAPLPMVLWQYGLINIDQLERIFDWLENQACLENPLRNQNL